jgi:glutamate-5-semialdehyde dehydrogenase
MNHPGQTLTQLTAGTVVPFGGDRYTVVGAELAAAFRAGDSLYVVPDTGALLHVPAAVRDLVRARVDAAVAAFAGLRTAAPAQIRRFFLTFAELLAVHWDAVAQVNAEDVARAEALGRSTTRLRVSERVRDDMVAGLHVWAEMLADGGGPAARRVVHDGWHVDVETAPLGVVGFVFEGRPNVLTDAAGVLATGNTAVLRIGGDALGTARAIAELALVPALRSAGLPEGAVGLVTSRERSAGWALFSDPRLALAVVRGSGTAVAQLASVARQSGIPVSAHGTGGAWLVADVSADAARLAGAVRHSLDRKVCNTLNVAVVVRERAADLVPTLLAAADQAAAARGGEARLHVAHGSEGWLPAAELERTIEVRRAEGIVVEPRADVIPVERLAQEWEWEGTPELSLVVVEDLDEAVELVNDLSPRFVASLVAEDAAAQARFFRAVDAPFVGDGFTRWVDGLYALRQPELGLSNWEHGRLLGRAGILSGADLTTRRVRAHHDSAEQHR